MPNSWPAGLPQSARRDSRAGDPESSRSGAGDPAQEVGVCSTPRCRCGVRWFGAPAHESPCVWRILGGRFAHAAAGARAGGGACSSGIQAKTSAAVGPFPRTRATRSAATTFAELFRSRLHELPPARHDLLRWDSISASAALRGAGTEIPTAARAGGGSWRELSRAAASA
jgi:hypothetical protein